MRDVRVEVVAYDPGWAEDFAAVEAALRSALVGVPLLAVEHVGSTSVPGLPAKPVIDVDVVVDEPSVRSAIDALAAVGYRDEGERGVPGRHALGAPDDEPRRHVYVCVDGCLALRNHLLVRDVLRADPELRAEYAAVKCGLAQRELVDMDAYVAGKNAVLHKVLLAGGLSPDDLDTVAASNPTPTS